MSRKESLVKKLRKKPYPKDFTTKELDTLMSQCGCEKKQGGRGSSIAYHHKRTGKILIFDGPHPGNELYGYQIKKVLEFLEELGEIKP